MAQVQFGRLLGASGFTRTVAVKRVHAQLAESPEFMSMLLDEARLVARIQHPNVVPTIDIVAADEEVLLVMEYVPGESLARLIRLAQEAGTTISEPIATSIVCGLLHGLHAAHTATSELDEPLEIVHRDVSPHNVLVGTDGLTRVLDFGIAKARGRVQTTRAGQVKGKLAYLAPEQISCDEVSPRTDVYAAAIVLWETLTCRRLFDGSNDGAVLHRVLAGDVPAPSTVVPGLSPALDALVLRGLARDPAQRFASAFDFAVALEDEIGFATTRRVAEWLSSTAGEALARRAAQVVEIERDSASVPQAPQRAPRSRRAATARSPEETTSDVIGLERGDPATQITETSGVSPPGHASSTSTTATTAVWPGPARRPRAVMALGVAALAALGGLAWWTTTRATAVPPVQPDAAAAGSVSPSPPVVAPTEPVAPALPQPSVAPSASAAPTVARPRPAPRPARPAAAGTARGAACDPPFTVDAQGVRRWKRECR
jgi:serine/threonine-protein kinase